MHVTKIWSVEFNPFKVTQTYQPSIKWHWKVKHIYTQAILLLSVSFVWLVCHFWMSVKMSVSLIIFYFSSLANDLKNSHDHKGHFAGLLQNISRTPLQDSSLLLLEFLNTALISFFVDCIQTNLLNPILDNLISWNLCVRGGMLQASRNETGNSNLSTHSSEHLRFKI